MHGHDLVGTDAADFEGADPLIAREPESAQRWHRCLRCDAWVALPPPASPTRDRVPGRDEIVLPLRGRPLKSRYILRLIAITRAFNFLVLTLVTAGVIAVLANQETLQQRLMAVANSMQDVFGGQAVDELQSILSVGAGTLWLVALGVAVLAAFEAFEGVGLWRGRRWAEYLTFVLTTLLLAPEILELTSTSSPGTIIALVVNVAVVIYLLIAKRLFGVRGGAPAETAEYEHDVSWAALERRLPGSFAPPHVNPGS